MGIILIQMKGGWHETGYICNPYTPVLMGVGCSRIRFVSDGYMFWVILSLYPYIESFRKIGLKANFFIYLFA